MKRRITKLRKSTRKGSFTGWEKRAYAAGLQRSAAFRQEGGNGYGPHLNRLWGQWLLNKSVGNWKSYHRANRQFIRGVSRGSSGRLNRMNRVLLPTMKRVAAILTIRDKRNKLSDVLDELYRLQLEEIIVVISGFTEDNLKKIRNHKAQPIVIHYDCPLGYDLDRAIGAKASRADILLFLDGNRVIPAQQLLPFLYAIEQGADIAVNKVTPSLHPFYQWDAVTMIKQFMNLSLGRESLGANSLAAVPHAISRHAAEKIGYSNLAVPPIAQAIAVRRGLKMVGSASVIRETRHQTGLTDIRLGDHLEALHGSMQALGERLYFPDAVRHRHSAEGDVS